MDLHLQMALIAILIGVGCFLAGIMVASCHYERRWKRALELERERERYRQFNMMGD